MSKFKKFLIYAICVMLLTSIAGCSEAQTPAGNTEKAETTDKKDDTGNDAEQLDTSKEVALSMYLIGTPAKDYDDVLKVFNEKAKSDLNCTLGVTWIGWGEFSTKYPLVLASGEAIDLIYTSNWLNFSTEAAKGAFMAIEDLAPVYAPLSYAAQSEGQKITCTVNGHLYAISPAFEQYGMMGYIVRGDLMDKYGMTEIKNIIDFGEYCKNVVAYDKQLDPSGFDSQASLLSYKLDELNYYGLGLTASIPLAVTCDDDGNPTNNVVFTLDDPALPEFFEMMKEWSNAGYWPKNVLSNKDTDMLTGGIAATRLHNFDSWVTAYMAHPEWDLRFYGGDHHSYLTSAVQDAMAIPASAKNPERALMLLEKLKNDESYYNLLTYGVEGVDYTMEDGFLKPTDPEIFAPEGYCSWGFKDPKFLKPLIGSPPNMQEVKDACKEKGIISPYVNFSFNPDAVKNEFAAVTNVMTQYCSPLSLGYVEDTVAELKNLKKQLKDAGIDKVKDELQAQVNTFFEEHVK